MKANLSRLALAGAFALGVATFPAAGQVPEPGLSDTNAALQYWQGFGMITVDMEKKLEDIDAVRFEGDALEMVRDDNNVLKYLYTGAAQPHCNWGLDLRTGPELLLPHLKLSREMGRLAVLRARYRFGQGHWHNGLADVLATFEMAKDVGDTPVMISLLVRYSIEQFAVDALAQHLDQMDRPALDELAKALETIPAPDGFKRVFPTESKYFIDWVIERLERMEEDAAGDPRKWSQAVLSSKWLSEQDAADMRRDGVPPPAEFKSTLASAKQLLVEDERMVDRPLAEQDAWLAGLEERFASKRLMRNFVPSQARSFMARRRWQARHAMLKAAVAVRRDGEAALKDSKYADPFGDGPFTYRKTDGGFELQSKLVDGKPITLAVGKSK